VLRERKGIAVHRLFADGPICRLPRSALHNVEHDGSFAEVNAFVTDRPGAPAPAVVAAKRSAHPPSGWICHGYVAPPHRQVVIHQKIRGRGIAHFLESFFAKRRGNGGFHFVAQGVIVGVRVALDRFASINFVARYYSARVSCSGLFLHRPPRPRGVLREMHIAIANDLHAFVTSRQQESAGQSGCGGERHSGPQIAPKEHGQALQKHHRYHPTG